MKQVFPDEQQIRPPWTRLRMVQMWPWASNTWGGYVVSWKNHWTRNSNIWVLILALPMYSYRLPSKHSLFGSQWLIFNMKHVDYTNYNVSLTKARELSLLTGSNQRPVFPFPSVSMSPLNPYTTLWGWPHVSCFNLKEVRSFAHHLWDLNIGLSDGRPPPSPSTVLCCLSEPGFMLCIYESETG